MHACVSFTDSVLQARLLCIAGSWWPLQHLAVPFGRQEALIPVL